MLSDQRLMHATSSSYSCSCKPIPVATKLLNISSHVTQIQNDQLLYYNAMMIIISVLIFNFYEDALSRSLLHMPQEWRESHVPVSDKESSIICRTDHSIAIGLQGEGRRGEGGGGGRGRKKEILRLIVFPLTNELFHAIVQCS